MGLRFLSAALIRQKMTGIDFFPVTHGMSEIYNGVNTSEGGLTHV